jgi:hypothetical protein
MGLDLSAWISIIALILIIPAGIASNLLTPRFVSYLGRRRLIKTHKTKQQALQFFNRIKAFREGTKDRYAYYILLASSGIMCVVGGSMFIIIFSIANYDKSSVSVEYFFIVVIGALAMVIGFLLLSGIYETARQLERFDDYRKEFENRWGPIE